MVHVSASECSCMCVALQITERVAGCADNMREFLSSCTMNVEGDGRRRRSSFGRRATRVKQLIECLQRIPLFSPDSHITASGTLPVLITLSRHPVRRDKTPGKTAICKMADASAEKIAHQHKLSLSLCTQMGFGEKLCKRGKVAK